MDRSWKLGLAVIAGILTGLAGYARAHCDTMQGPVIKDARTALAKSDITPVLKWVKPAGESEVKAAFNAALDARAKGGAAREKADLRFFGILVKVHRAGEGAPYTGLKEGSPEPVIAHADEAIETGDVSGVASHLAKAIDKGIRERFARVSAARKHAEESVEAGRKYVEAYVEYVHFIERIHLAMAAVAGHGHGGEADEAAGHGGDAK